VKVLISGTGNKKNTITGIDQIVLNLRHYFVLLVTAYHQFNTTRMSIVGNMGVAIKNVLPPSVELKIYLHVIHCSQVIFTTSGLEPPFWPSVWC